MLHKDKRPEADDSTFENYEYKESDIVNKQEESLWRIITIRYRKSGFRRLFKKRN